MIDLWIAFFTGLTAGGLSCMAVQGGLLASSLASQVEKDLQDCQLCSQAAKRTGLQLGAPITVFLLTKLTAYTLFGFLLGALGSTLALTPMMRAILQFAIGVFMVGNALRMFDVHPVFRYFSIGPPYIVKRFIRKSSKGRTALAAPVFLGAMTVLIPCGVTQSMMAVALGSASPLGGATIMFAFTLGTTPVFFALAYSAARLGAMLDRYFMRLVAVVIFILGIVAFDTGLNLAGAPFSLTSTWESLVAAADASPNAAAELTLEAQNQGYVPRTLNARANQSITLNVVTLNTTSCTRSFVIPELELARDLPVTGITTVNLPAQTKGKVLRFMCTDGMYTGQVVFR